MSANRQQGLLHEVRLRPELAGKRDAAVGVVSRVAARVGCTIGLDLIMRGEPADRTRTFTF
jgi:hypothetical protein